MSARKHGYFRRPRTAQEKRWNTAHVRFVRGRRHAVNIPSAWEDQMKSRDSSKSWKDKFKKRKQWNWAQFKESWLLRFGYWVTPTCYNNGRRRYSKPIPCPGCPVCHTRSESTRRKLLRK